MLGIFSSYARQGFPAVDAGFLTLDEKGAMAQADSCDADFLANSLNNQFRLVLFTNLSSSTFVVPNGEVVYTWYFGDGIFSYDRDPQHSYATNGSYNVCLQQLVRDSITGQVFCADTICKTVVVNYQPPACNAEYIVDTANSFAGDIVVWNTSSPNSRDSLHTVNYHWDFGDGDTSVLAFPTHTYSQAGEYEVCLRVSSYDSVNNLCSNLYCDIFGADSIGNLIYKNGASGFTINVMDPYSIGEVEHNVPKFEIYPNPAKEYFVVSLYEKNEETLHWEIVDINGMVVQQGKDRLIGKENIEIQTATLSEGLYVLRLIVDSRNPVTYYKLRVDR